MKVYLAHDWRGVHVYKTEPHLLEHLPAFPPTFTGYELKEFILDENYAEQIPLNTFEEHNIWWNIIKMI